MCGRYTLTTPGDLLAETFGLEEVPELAPRYNIAPTQEVAVVRDAQGARRLDWMRWGLVPRWAKDPGIGSRLINARSETAAEKPAFRSAFRRRRCLVPADGFFEWRSRNGGKEPVWIHLPDRRPFAIAGLWERWGEPAETALRSCTLLTVAASPAVLPVHHRMPALLPPDRWPLWLDPEVDDTEALSELLRPSDAPLELRAVSTRVNNVAHDDASILDPAEGDPPPPQGSLF